MVDRQVSSYEANLLAGFSEEVLFYVVSEGGGKGFDGSLDVLKRGC